MTAACGNQLPAVILEQSKDLAHLHERRIACSVGVTSAVTSRWTCPAPIDFLLNVMEWRGLSRMDLGPYIGSRARVAEVLNRVRPLTLEMIRRLASGLKLPADVLIRGYELKRAA